MGTTLTAAVLEGSRVHLAHVGDSRAYLWRAGGLHRLTRDHTYAQMMVDMGQLRPGDVAGSRTRHILTNVLGGSADNVDVDIDLLCLEDGDRLLLCSDGLTDLVEDDMITKTLSEAQSSSEACTQLVHHALESGGRDNVTVIVAAYTIPEEPVEDI
jgi:protein phosphatase